MKLTVPAIRAGELDTDRAERAGHTLQLLEEIDALLAESMGTAPARELDRKRRACMAVHPSAGATAARAASRPVPPAAA